MGEKENLCYGPGLELWSDIFYTNLWIVNSNVVGIEFHVNANDLTWRDTRIKYSYLKISNEALNGELVWTSSFQVVLTVSQTMWCADVTACLTTERNRLQAMEQFEQKSFQNLNNLAALVRGDLPKLTRSILCALITIDVHARDIISGMVEEKVISRKLMLASLCFFISLLLHKDFRFSLVQPVECAVLSQW